MASILDRYGIKEVADVTFYEINDDGSQGKPVLFLDTLKVSTIEQTAETADARGGKGNPKLITWDYGKEITVNIEDALFSPKSMAIMLGNGVAGKKGKDVVTRTVAARIGTDGKIDYVTADVYDASEKGAVRKKLDMKVSESSNSSARAGMIDFDTAGLAKESTTYTITSEDGATVVSQLNNAAAIQSAIASASGISAGQKVYITYTQEVDRSEIVVSADSFPGTYYITGDTYARSDVSGKDQFFQFIIPKAKVTAENTITLEAEGDPSTFSMNLTVLRPEDGDMMKLVQYDLLPNS